LLGVLVKTQGVYSQNVMLTVHFTVANCY